MAPSRRAERVEASADEYYNHRFNSPPPPEDYELGHTNNHNELPGSRTVAAHRTSSSQSNLLSNRPVTGSSPPPPFRFSNDSNNPYRPRARPPPLTMPPPTRSQEHLATRIDMPSPLSYDEKDVSEFGSEEESKYIPKREGVSSNGRSSPTLNHRSSCSSVPTDSSTTNKSRSESAPDTKLSRIWVTLLSSSWIIRWMVYIIPLLTIIWIPGVIGAVAFPKATFYSIPLVWLSVWLTIVWCGWWFALALALLAPKILQITIGTVAPEARHWLDYLDALSRYIALAAHTLLIWLTFTWVVRPHGAPDSSHGDGKVLHLINQALFAIFLDSAALLGLKLFIQIVSYQYHQRSYADRIVQHKFQIKCLLVLYLNSSDSNLPDDDKDGGLFARFAGEKGKQSSQEPHSSLAFDSVTRSATTSQGETVFQPNSPAAMVTAALSSSNNTRKLARRIFYSFVPLDEKRKTLELQDILPYFDSKELAQQAFAMLDRDGNGDAKLDEVELACLDIHRQRLALASSMRDLDSAVGMLSHILMSFYSVVAILVLIAFMDVGVSALLASAGTLILGLSWLIGTTAQEILGGIVFLFVKHAYDVGDRVDIVTATGIEKYVVKEMQLLSTVFKRLDGVIVQIPHSILATQPILNIRRSGPIAENFEFNVAFSTSFHQIEQLRSRMLAFLIAEKRDFLPTMDITIKDFENQAKMTLISSIPYRSNWQNGALRAQRRNKWVCALKLAMNSLKIYGPAGSPGGSPHIPDSPSGHLNPPSKPVEGIPVVPPSMQGAAAFALVDNQGVLNDPSSNVYGDTEHTESLNVGSGTHQEAFSPSSTLRQGNSSIEMETR